MEFRLIQNPNLLIGERKSFCLDELLEKRGFNFVRLDDFDIVDAARKGFHIVTIGFIGLTNFSAICQFAFGIDQNEQYEFIQLVNSKKETGTLWPKYNLTILPYRYLTTPVMTIGTYDFTDGKNFSNNEVRTHLEDALEAEIKYIKSGKIVFDFFNLGEDIARYTRILIDLLTLDNRYKDKNWECYIYSICNSE